MLRENEQVKKVILITGAARRVGASIARHLHHHGYQIIIHYRTSQAPAQLLCAELNQLRADSAQICQADLADFAAVDQLITKSLACWQRLDGIVNNASTFFPTLLAHTTPAQWDNLFAANVKAPFFLTQAALPYLRQQQGCVVNITDIHGCKPLKDYAVYSMAKAALQQQTKCLALELAPEIRVNAVAPGVVLLPEGENALSATMQQHILNKTALKRYGTPDDIAKAVLFLLENDYITGTTITVDGGRLVG